MLDNSKPKAQQNNSSRNNTQTHTDLILSYNKNNLKILVYPIHDNIILYTLLLYWLMTTLYDNNFVLIGIIIIIYLFIHLKCNIYENKIGTNKAS